MFRIPGPVRFLPLALLGFALILSAAAWGAHSASHGAALAAADGAHHAGAALPGAPDRDGQDGGHDHRTSLFFPVAALFGADPLPPPAPVAAAPPVAQVATLAFRPGDPPPADPPRAA